MRATEKLPLVRFRVDIILLVWLLNFTYFGTLARLAFETKDLQPTIPVRGLKLTMSKLVRSTFLFCFIVKIFVFTQSALLACLIISFRDDSIFLQFRFRVMNVAAIMVLVFAFQLCLFKTYCYIM